MKWWLSGVNRQSGRSGLAATFGQLGTQFTQRPCTFSRRTYLWLTPRRKKITPGTDILNGWTLRPREQLEIGAFVSRREVERGH